MAAIEALSLADAGKRDPWAACVARLEQSRAEDLPQWEGGRCHRYVLSDAPVPKDEFGSTGLVNTPVCRGLDILAALEQAGGSATVAALARALKISVAAVRPGISLLRRSGEIRKCRDVCRIS